MRFYRIKGERVFSRLHKITGENCAVKVLEKKKILEKDSISQFLYEITILKSMKFMA